MPPRHEAQEERDYQLQSSRRCRRGTRRRRSETINSSQIAISDEARIAAAQAYIDALVSHDGDAVPFAADCTRVEQGIKNGFSGKHLRRSLTRGLQYRIIASTTPPEYTIEGDQVRARYTVSTILSFGGRRAAALVDETFVIPPSDGRIHHIRVRFHPRLMKE